MKIAIMQPYFFPYIGYFQLVSAVDKFIFYDDVNFIKQGWINRNRIQINKKPEYFTVPLSNVSSFKEIQNIKINEKEYFAWQNKFLKTLYFNYKKAPYFEFTYKIIKAFLTINYNDSSISKLAADSIIEVAKYLGVNTNFEFSSIAYGNTANLKKEKRLIEICKLNNARTYINPIGGLSLYSKEDFSKDGIDLYFLKTKPITYKQFDNEFVPNLSIIDVMMFNSKERIREMLNEYELI